MKKLLSIILALLMLTALVACGAPADNGDGTDSAVDTTLDTSNEAEIDYNTKFNITVIAGTTGMGFAKLMNDDKNGEAKFDYNFEVVSGADLASSAIIGGKANLAAVPTNLAAVLHQKTGGEVQVVAANTLGVLYLIENGETVTDIASLKGKTVYCCQQGANPEYITNYLLTENGLKVGEDVILDFTYNTPDELTTAIGSGIVDLAVLPEPKVTAALSQNESLRRAINFSDEWEKVSGGLPLVQGCLIATKSFIDAHSAELALFLEEYKASIDFVNANADEASKMIEEFGIIPKAPLAKKAIPNCNIAFLAGEEMAEGMMSFYRVLYAANPASVGGAEPDSAKLFFVAK
ncbi:MAG: ABC transporter substrate-binding protein [Ruminococcaceae bacterium]|nr:ABC transporter substrate-binding protein [Oscillospiraceae bacterium]